MDIHAGNCRSWRGSWDVNTLRLPQFQQTEEVLYVTVLSG